MQLESCGHLKKNWSMELLQIDSCDEHSLHQVSIHKVWIPMKLMLKFKKTACRLKKGESEWYTIFSI